MSNVHHTSVWSALSISRNQNQELYCLLSAMLLLPSTNFAFYFFWVPHYPKGNSTKEFLKRD